MEYIIRKEDTLAIKGIAILMMLWHHLFSYYPLDAPFAYIIRTTAAMGNICVGLFLMVSAYGLTIQANNLHITKTIDYVRFIVKRIVKFLFSYWIIFFPSVLLGVVWGGVLA